MWFPRSSLISWLLLSPQLLWVPRILSFPWKDSDFYTTLTRWLILFHSLIVFAGVTSSEKSSLIIPSSAQPPIVVVGKIFLVHLKLPKCDWHMFKDLEEILTVVITIIFFFLLLDIVYKLMCASHLCLINWIKIDFQLQQDCNFSGLV